MAENQFNPALPLPIKWSIGDDRFNEGQQVLSLTCLLYTSDAADE